MNVKTAPPLINGNGSETVSAILCSTNYDLFRIMENNRDLNELHVRRLVESFKERQLVCPIIVNEKYEVIDGQHRLAACKETGLPVYYFKIKGYGINEVQILNTNQKNWLKMDYLNMYCHQGKENYLKLQKFMELFPDFGIKSAERIITLKGSSSNTGMLAGKKANMKDFEEGKLFIPNLRKSYDVANRLIDFKPYFKDFHSGTFVSAMLPLLIKSKFYNHKEMIHKVSTCPIKLRVCNNVEAYRMLLEEIYNYKRQKENKVSFRYE